MLRVTSLACLLLLGCASAGKATTGDDGGDDTPVDGSPLVDTPPPIDAAPAMVTLSQTSQTTIGPSSSVTCGNSTTTSENSWYRVFKLSDSGITSDLTLSTISFGVQEAVGTPTVDIKVGTYAGVASTTSIDPSMITPIATATATVADATATTTRLDTVPLAATIPAGSQLVVEIHLASQTNKIFYIGGNASAETHVSYLRAPACITDGTVKTPAALGFATSAIVIIATGTHQP